MMQLEERMCNVRLSGAGLGRYRGGGPRRRGSCKNQRWCLFYAFESAVHTAARILNFTSNPKSRGFRLGTYRGGKHSRNGSVKKEDGGCAMGARSTAR